MLSECAKVMTDLHESDGRLRVFTYDTMSAEKLNYANMFIGEVGADGLPMATKSQLISPTVYVMNHHGSTVARYTL